MNAPNPQSQKSTLMIQLLYTINRLTQKAFTAKNKNSLIFTILNDTIHLVHYDRATLWNIEGKKPNLLGVSGQAQIKKKGKLVKEWEDQLRQLGDLSQPRTITLKSPDREEHIEAVWLPILYEEKPILGLWLETWHKEQKKRPNPKDWVRVLMDLLMPVYGQAWERLTRSSPGRILVKHKKHWVFFIIAFFVLTLLIPVPLRVVASCEIVPLDPYIITAPLNGIVKKIIVQPGQKVYKGELLFVYDKKVPLQDLEIAKKSVEVLQSEVNRAATLGLSDPKIRAQYAILKSKLEKENVKLDLAKYHASQLDVTSPVSGEADIERPDLWRGKPVKIGERVLQINNPEKTKVRLWIPESDNIEFLRNKPIEIFLNTHPTESIPAKLEWISNESTISKDKVVSFMGEARWINKPPKDAKLGVKGSAFLYGKDVSIFYFFMRKPIRYLRSFFGV